MKVTKRKAPWTDHDGNELFEGDIIEHPNGEREGGLNFTVDLPLYQTNGESIMGRAR